MESLVWAKPSIAQVHESMQDFLNYSRDLQIERYSNPTDYKGLKLLCDIDRVCEVEDSVYDW